MKPPTATEIVLERTLKYYAVDKTGRRMSVDRADVEAHYEKWREDGVTLETDVLVRKVPAYGKVNLISS